MSNSATPWTKVCQASLSFTISRSLLKLMMPSNQLILCHPLLLQLSVFLPSGSFPMSPLLPTDGQSTGALEVLEESFRVDFLQDWAYTLKFFKKSLLNLLQCCLCFIFFSGPEAFGILTPQLGIKPTPPALEGEVLTNRLPGKSLFLIFFYAWYLTMEE